MCNRGNYSNKLRGLSLSVCLPEQPIRVLSLIGKSRLFYMLNLPKCLTAVAQFWRCCSDHTDQSHRLSDSPDKSLPPGWPSVWAFSLLSLWCNWECPTAVSKLCQGYKSVVPEYIWCSSKRLQAAWLLLLCVINDNKWKVFVFWAVVRIKEAFEDVTLGSDKLTSIFNTYWHVME